MEEFDLEPGEVVQRAVRKHWFVLVIEVLPFLLLAILPLFLPGILNLLTEPGMVGIDRIVSLLSIDNPWARLILGLWWLVLWIAAFNTFTSYYLNQWIITSHRIIEIDQHGFFNRQVSSLLLNRVQDVTSDVRGLFATLLGYGTITVQSAGANDYFRMHGIPHPADLRDLIMKEIAALHAPNPGGIL